MTTNKLTLIVDGNWLMMSRMASFIKLFDKSQPEIVKKNASKNLEEQMAKSIGIILNKFKEIDNVVLVADGGSWRKKLAIPKILLSEETTYKGNRKQSIDIDWNYIYNSFTNLYNHCKDLGLTCSQSFDCEGDDWVWYWSRRLNESGINCIIWSSDNDLKQLVQYNKNTRTFTAWYNGKNYMSFSSDLYEPETDPVEFFMSPQKRFLPVFESFKNNVNISIEYVQPFDIIVDKIFQGDSGDNIKPIVQYKWNGRTYKMTKKEFNNIIVKFSIKTIEDIESQQDSISEYVATMINNKSKGCTVHSQDINDMITYNINLVWLNEKTIPETIIMSMNHSEYKKINDLNYIRLNYKTLLGKDQTIEDIFNSI